LIHFYKRQFVICGTLILCWHVANYLIPRSILMPPLTTLVPSLEMLNRKRKISQSGADDAKKAKLENQTDLIKVKKMSRNDLEELVSQKIVEALTVRGKYGELSRKFDRMSAAYMKVKNKASALQKQLEDLEEVTKRIKVTEGTKLVRIPKITRCVGIQVSSKIKLDFVKKAVTADKDKKSTVIDISDENKRADEIACSTEDKVVNDDHADLGRKDKEKDVLKNKRKPSNNSRINKIGGYADKEQGDKEQTDIKDSREEPLSLSVKKSESTDVIVITWAKRLDSLDVNSILNYELEGAKGEKMKWSRIGNLIKPLPLPMVCTLNKFKRGVLYNFRVKVITSDKTLFSNIASITL